MSHLLAVGSNTDRDSDEPARATSPEGSGSTALRTTALVVEDDPFSAFALKALLERGQLAVVEARTGEQALDVIDRGFDIGIVFMDISLPVMDGYETMAVIRKRPHLVDLPIVALTARDPAGERARCLAAGASDFISKPLDIATLWSTLTTWLTTPYSLPGAHRRVRHFEVTP